MLKHDKCENQDSESEAHTDYCFPAPIPPAVFNCSQKPSARGTAVSDLSHDSLVKTLGELRLRQSALLLDPDCEIRHLEVISAAARTGFKMFFQPRPSVVVQGAGTDPGDQPFVGGARFHRGFSFLSRQFSLTSSIFLRFSRALNNRDFTVPSEQFRA